MWYSRHMIRPRALLPSVFFAAMLAAGISHDSASLWSDPAFTHEETSAVAWAYDKWVKAAEDHNTALHGTDVYACPDFLAKVLGTVDGASVLGACWFRYVCVFREQIETTVASTPGATYNDVFANVVLHEIGHAQGVDHVDNEKAVMSSGLGLPPFPLALTEDDVAGVNAW